MACQVVTREMVIKGKIVEQELFTQVAVGMRKNLTMSVITGVTKLNVISQGLHMIHALLSNEDCAPFQAHFAKCLVVLSL